MTTTKKANKSINAAAWFYAPQTFISRDVLEPKCCNCKTNRARWYSLYCSDDCKAQFLSFEEEK